MKILQLAPHPFFQERGTPIDVSLVLRVLSERENTSVDILVYNEGVDIRLHGIIIYRIPNLKFLKNVRPGYSTKKLLCNFFLLIEAWKLIKNNKYDLIHAGEEAVFIAMLFKFLYKIPYAYDLDSSIAQQLVEKKPFLKFLSPFFSWLETKAIQGSLVNLPVCNALAELCEKSGSRKTVTIHDISQLKNPGAKSTGFLKKELGIDKFILLYAGNLEPYQGIDLLINSFNLVAKENDLVDLVIIGGIPEDIKKYKNMVSELGMIERIHFLGPKPFETIDKYMIEADILVAPRIRGINTPMKVFPYLHSGKPVLLTDLYTHNQLLSSNEAYLAAATPREFANGIIELVNNEELRQKLGKNGKEFIEKNHVFESHKRRLNEVYDWIEQQIFNSKIDKDI
jgi:glycosyltransferase involved in cell wall biosynthesis